MEYTKWVAIRLFKCSGDVNELFDHLAMNGYTYDVAFNDNGNHTLFVAEDELSYVLTIIDDRELKFEML